MKSIRLPATALAAAGVLASCGAGGDAGAGSDAAPSEGFAMKSGDLFNDDSQKIVDRYGASNPMYDKSGQRKAATENSMVNDRFNGDFAKQRYQGDLRDYEKRSFWGRKDYTKEVYGGDTDGGRFLRSAREGAIGAREGGVASREDGRLMATEAVDKPAAREGQAAVLDRPSDAETDFRRRVFQEPEVKDWRRQRALEVEDTRAMLGR